MEKVTSNSKLQLKGRKKKSVYIYEKVAQMSGVSFYTSCVVTFHRSPQQGCSNAIWVAAAEPFLQVFIHLQSS